MKDRSVDKILEQVAHIMCTKEPRGYKITIGQEDIYLPLATNFEWRMSKPVSVNHMYFGNETGKSRDISFDIDFEKPCNVRIQNVDARCYMYVTPME